MQNIYRLLAAAAFVLAVPALSARAQDAGTASPADRAELAKLLQDAQALYDQGRYEKARTKLDELHRLDPAFPGAAKLGDSVDVALRRERLSLYRKAALTDASSPDAPEGGADGTLAAAADDMIRPPDPKSVKSDPGRLYERAEELLYERKFDAARKALAGIGPDDEQFDRARMLRARIDAWEAKAAAQKVPDVPRDMEQYLEARLTREIAMARQAFTEGRWAETVRACEKMLAYAPNDQRVRRLLQDARIELTDARVRRIEADSERRMREVLGETEKLMTPPEDLPKLTRQKPEPEFHIPTQDELALEKKLNEKVSIDLIEAPLSYVLDLLARSIGVNIIVNPAAVEGKTITINVQDTTLKEVLDFITRNEGVSFTRGKNTIYVTTPDRPMLSMRIFHLSKGLTDSAADITPQGSASVGTGATGGGGGGAAGGGGGGAKPSDTSDIERLLEQLPMLIEWPAGSTYYLDRKRNVLFLRSTPETLDTVEKMIQALDENPIQVLITTRFIEVDAENLKDLGIEWNLTNDYAVTEKGGADKLVIDAGTGTVFDPRVASEAADTVSSADGFTFGLTGILTEPQFQIAMKTLASEYKGRVTNAPRMLAVNNTPARIQETEDLWYVDDYRIDRTDLTGAEDVETSEPVVVPEFARGPSIGFGLTVTPSVGKDSRDITLLLEPVFRRKSADSITSPLILPGELDPVSIERPIVVDRRMWAKVTVRDGYHVAIGGMVSATKKEIQQKVPILADIPLIGQLFQRNTTRNVRKHLLIFVSAEILNPEGRKYKTADEEREERRKKAELTRGVGVDWVRVKETRQVLGPGDGAAERRKNDDIIDLKEVDFE
jgi:Flp pilus assembly secretin CpaC/tetratricopeptide (TPR) repeat protein